MSYTLNWEDEGFKVATTGTFGDGFIKAHIAAITDPRFIEAKYSIIDLKNVDDFPIGSETIWQMSLSDVTAYKLNPNLTVAIIASSVVVDSLTHMYKVYAELNNQGHVWNIEIFDNEKRAREWIKTEREKIWSKAKLSNEAVAHKTNPLH